MGASHQLRTRTAACHEAVDAAFGGVDLGSPDAYRHLLTAHARALIPAERTILPWSDLPRWSPRSAALLGDLAALGTAVPPALTFAIADAAGAWGTLYVLEGSRLGNLVLSRQVAPGLPTSYMAARHGAGEWRALLAAIDMAGDEGGAPWLDRAVAGAEATFALYLAASEGLPRSARSG